MAEQKGSPTKKTISPQPHQNEVKTSVEVEMERLSKKIQEANAGNKQSQEDLVGSLKDTLSKVIVNLKSEDKIVRRQNLLALKQTRAQIATLEEGALSDKETVIKGIDAVVKAAEHQTSATSALTAKVGKDFLKSLPTAKGFLSAFVKNSNPLLQVALNVVTDIGGLIKEGRKKDDEKRAKDIDAQAKQLEALKANEKTAAQQVAAIKDEAKTKELERKKRVTSSKKGEGPVVGRLEKLRSATEVQTRLLQAIYEDLSGKKFDLQELIKQDAEMLQEFVEGMKEGIAQEGKALKVDPELIKGIQDAVDSDAAELIKAFQGAGLDQKSAIEKATQAITEQTLFLRKAEEEKTRQEFKGRVQKPAKSPLVDRSGGLFKKGEGGIVGFIKDFMKNISEFIGSTLGVAGRALSAVGAFGAKALGVFRLLGKASGFLTVALAVLDFFSGFTNADKILGKSKDALTLWDKISAGLGMVVEGFLSLFDFLGGFIGFKTGWSKGLSTKVAKFFVAIGDSVSEFFTASWKMLDEGWTATKEAFDKYTSKEYWAKKVDDAVSFVQKIPDMIIDFIKSILREELSFIPESMRPAWLDKALAPSQGSKDTAPTMTAVPAIKPALTPQQIEGIVTEIPKRAGLSTDIKQADSEIAEQKKRDEAKKAAAVLTSQSNNTVNANTTNYYPAPLRTRTDDDSVRQWAQPAWA